MLITSIIIRVVVFATQVARLCRAVWSRIQCAWVAGLGMNLRDLINLKHTLREGVKHLASTNQTRAKFVEEMDVNPDKKKKAKALRVVTLAPPKAD